MDALRQAKARRGSEGVVNEILVAKDCECLSVSSLTSLISTHYESMSSYNKSKMAYGNLTISTRERVL